MSVHRWLAAALTALSLDAAAVYVNPDGHGEILVYPYFTAQDSDGNAFNTYVSLANGATDTKALRVRVREGRNGREVAGFNLLLAPGDMWTGAVIPSAMGATLVTTDASCVSPAMHSDVSPPPPSFLDFSSAGYTGVSLADEYGLDIERLREGYVEVFEMASLSLAPSCAAFRADTPGQLLPPSGKLSGTLTLINVQSGLDFTVNAVALDHVATAPYFRPPADSYPDYEATEIRPYASFFHGRRLYRTQWLGPLQAVNAALLVEALENEFVADRATRSQTDFVVTLPTKRLAFNRPPFDFLQITGGNVPFYLSYSSRERDEWGLGRCDSLCPVESIADMKLKWSATVLSLRLAAHAHGGPGVSDVLGSRNAWLIDLPTPWENGYASVQLGGSMETEWPLLHSRIDLASGTPTDVRPTYWGLPAVGFMARTFRNGTLSCTGAACQGNYGGAFPHRYRRTAYPF